MIKLNNLLNEGTRENLVLEFIKNNIKGTQFEGNVFLAGGAVRDELMGKDIKDIDLLISKIPNGGVEFANFITKKLNIYRENSNPIIFQKFGTAKFNLRGILYKGEDLSDIDIECVMTRKEQYHDDSRKLDVVQGSIEDDVARRDFTVNSLLKDLTTGEILDLTGKGKEDIKKGVVQTTLDPDIIFAEDPLRQLRAIRFSVKYDWKLPMFMIRAIKNNAHRLDIISKERIKDELDKILLTKNPVRGIKLIKITGLIDHIFPELKELIGLSQNKYHHLDAFKHSMEVLKNTPPDLVSRISSLFHDVGKGRTKTVVGETIHFLEHEDIGASMAKEILKRLKYPNEIIDAVYTIIKNHMRLKNSGNEGENISDKALRKLKRDVNPFLEHLLDVMHADNISHSEDASMPNQIPKIRDRYKNLQDIPVSQHLPLPISGKDIIDIFNIKQGPEIGNLLKIIEDEYFSNPKLTKNEAINIIRQKLNER